MDAQKETVTLYNGEPRIKVTKMVAGYYQWATKATGMFDHSLLEEVDNYMKRKGYEYFVVDQKIEDVEDEQYVPFRG